MKVVRSTHGRPVTMLYAFVILLLMAPLVPWTAILAEDAPGSEGKPEAAVEPTSAGAPVQALAVETEPPSPTPSPTSPPPPTATHPPAVTDPPVLDETESPAETEPPIPDETEPVVPTEVEPTEAMTVEPSGPDATDAPEEEPLAPTTDDVLSPEGSPAASAGEENLTEISGVSLLALPPVGSGQLTLNGQTGTVYLTTSTPLNFHVPDIANLAAVFPVSGGYAMSTTISEYYEQWGCDRGGYRYHRHFGPYPNYTWDMTLPPRAPGLYSFQAGVYVSDLQGHQLALGRTQCIDVSVSSNSPFLLVNGSGGPIVSDDVTPLTFAAGDLPPESVKHQLVVSGNSDCASPWLVTSFGPGVVAAHTIDSPTPGVSWYQVRSHNANGFPLAKTACVRVEVTSAVATLRINGEAVDVSIVDGQVANLFATGLPAGQMANLMYFPGAGCQGPSFIDPTSPYQVSGAGQIDRSHTIYVPGTRSVSVLFSTPTRQTNCVSIHYVLSDAELLVNGSRGPIAVVLGDELHLKATGLPPGAGAFPAFGCDLADIPDDLGGTVGQDGTIEFYLSDGFPEDAFNVQVRLLPPATTATNCVFVQYFDLEVDPALTINGGSDPATVLVNDVYGIAATGLPPVTLVTLARYSESGDCTGEVSSLESVTSEEGTLTTSGSQSEAGTWSYRVLTPRGDTNCVAVLVVGDPVLTINGGSGPLTVMAGTTLNLELSGWPTGIGTLTSFPRETSLGDVCESPPFNVFPVPPPGADGTALSSIPTFDSMEGTRSYRITGALDVDGTTVSFATNCVTVTVATWAPQVTVNGSAGPLDVTTTTPLTIEMSNFPDTAYQARLYPSRTGSDCSGAATSSDLYTRVPGQEAIAVSHPPLPNPAGVPYAYSFNAQIHYRSDTGEELLLWSNCVLVIVDDDAVIVDPPTEEPTEPPTEEPAEPATEEPTEQVTEEPTEEPTEPSTTEEPTEPATEGPTDVPTEGPTEPATEDPTEAPTDVPAQDPTDAATEEPTDAPTQDPTDPATEPATEVPTGQATDEPTEPVASPATGEPTLTPTVPAGWPGGPSAGGRGLGALSGMTGGDSVNSGDTEVSTLPVTGSGKSDRSLFVLLAISAVLFAGAGSLVSRGGRRP